MDRDTAIILALAAILINEKADRYLIMALVYILS